MTRAYDRDLAKLARKAATQVGVRLDEGVYAALKGPTYETPAEIRMYTAMGGGVVGMTGYPEVVLAREAEIPYAAVAVVSNVAAGMGDGAISHDEIWEMLEATKDPLFRLLGRAVQLHSTGEC